jgi:hypothetical protein
MKKAAFLALLLAGGAAFALEWELPVVTASYEAAAGAREDEGDDEADPAMVPASARSTVSLRIREEASPAVFGLLVRYSTKDYLLEAGDYSYLEAGPEAALRIGRLLRLGAALGAKIEQFGQPDVGGLSKDFLALKARLEATLSPVRGTSIEAGLGARFDCTEEPAKARQSWTAAAGFSSRLGQWLLSARYRGEFRLPMGAASAAVPAAYNLGSVSVQWDPNR